MNKTPELLPCPFCGGEADIYRDRIMFPGEPVYFYSSCKNGECPGAMAPDGEIGTNLIMLETEEEAISLWNTRVYPPEVQAAIERDTPKEPVSRPMGWIDFNADHCPNCDTQLHEYTDKDVTFCYSCGQRMRWSEE